MGLALMLVIFGVGVIVAVFMMYRTVGKGKHEETNPEAGSRPNPQGPTEQNIT